MITLKIRNKNAINIFMPYVSAWIGSIAFGMNFLCGPIASSLCQRYGCRVVSAAGGLIAVLGLLLTSFTNSLYVIYFTYSVLWGFGSSLNYAPTMLVLGKLKCHYDQKITFIFSSDFETMFIKHSPSEI